MQQQLPTQTMVATQQHSKSTVKTTTNKNKITKKTFLYFLFPYIYQQD
jgi:hypothetical protein